MFVAAFATLYAACAAPPPPDAPSAGGEAYRFDPGQPEVLAIGFGMLGPDFVAAPVPPALPALAPAALTEVVDDVWFGGFVAVGADGAFEVPLPDPADVPVATLVPLAAAVANFEGACTVDAAPLGAEATFTLFGGLALPGLVALTADGSFLMAASNPEVDGFVSLGDFEGDFFSWMYVDRDATLATSGCSYAADLVVEEGWNLLAWTPQGGGSSIVVAVVADAEVLATPLLRFPPDDDLVMIVGHD